ncbi:glycosyltransferase family 4 protein [Riemerella anatipestifer]|uniref:glycosyltransferase family 4 protein n=1 Tax=Riemerella anatipestifer TaxID=34085 RepID=UPI002097F5D5|nr:glycosyltransferase family 4 protein [Riemerella anatipestifer]MCO7355842.1 glycosyltransferase family 4 protein [Riemerella anatipestifer]MCW0518357.1 glycosyltransferase family 4 protein [Riemerella anatipestifer]
MKPKLIRLSTIPLSMNVLLKGQLAFFNKSFEVIAVSGGGKDLSEVKEREGVRAIELKMERKISPIRDLLSLIKLYFLFLKEKPEIVHSITPKAGLLSMLAAKFAGVPIRIHTFTGLIFPSKTGMLKKILILMDRLLCWAATNIYPEGQGVKNDLIKYKITQKSLNVIANGNVNGIDIAHFSPQQVSEEVKQQLKQDLNIQDTDFVFVFVGRLVGDKGINELVAAFKQLDVENTKLLLVGAEERNLDPLKEDTIYEIENNKNIIAVGYQTDVRPYFAIADALVFPSYREGFPNVVMQAGAMGLPSIVSDINGCNEIIIEGKNGWIIPPKNVEELYLAMRRMMEDKKAYLDLKTQSRQMIVDRYQQQVVWEALLQEYKQLLNGIN